MRVRSELGTAWTPRTRQGTRVLGVLGVRAFPSSNSYENTFGFWEEEKKEADVTTTSDRRRVIIGCKANRMRYMRRDRCHRDSIASGTVSDLHIASLEPRAKSR